MYEKDGEQYFIVDAHIAFWDARPENRNRLGEGFIKCFYDYHRNLGPEEYLWPFEEKFVKYTEEDLMHDLFEVGYVDHALKHEVDALAPDRRRDAAHDIPRHRFPDDDGHAAQGTEVVQRALHRRRRRALSRHDLDEGDQLGRIEGVSHETAIESAAAGEDLVGRQRGR